MLATLFFLICLAGFLISAYLTAVYLDVRIPFLNSVMKLCGLEAEECKRIIQTGPSHLFGYANFIYALFYYMALMAALIFSFPFKTLFIVLAWFVVAVSLYLAIQLFFILKMRCRFCIMAWMINICIAILLHIL